MELTGDENTMFASVRLDHSNQYATYATRFNLSHALPIWVVSGGSKFSSCCLGMAGLLRNDQTLMKK